MKSVCCVSVLLTGARVAGQKRRHYLPNKPHFHLHTGAGSELTLPSAQGSADPTALPTSVQPEHKLRHFVRIPQLLLNSAASVWNTVKQRLTRVMEPFCSNVDWGQLVPLEGCITCRTVPHVCTEQMRGWQPVDRAELPPFLLDSPRPSTSQPARELREPPPFSHMSIFLVAYF